MTSDRIEQVAQVAASAMDGYSEGASHIEDYRIIARALAEEGLIAPRTNRQGEPMPYRRRELIGMWLQKWAILHPLLLQLDNHGILPDGRRRYVNRVSRHLVMKGPR